MIPSQQKPWVIVGAGNFTGDLIDAIAARGELLAWVVLNQALPATANLPVGKDVSLDQFFKQTAILALTDYQYIFGFVNPNKRELLEQLQRQGVPKHAFSNLVHPSACISSSAKLGCGNFFGSQVAIACHTKIGNFNYFNRCCSFGHDSVVGDYNHIGPGAVVCGSCTLGNENFLGANSTIINSKSIDNAIILGAGAVCRTNLIEPGTYVGVPTRKLK